MKQQINEILKKINEMLEKQAMTFDPTPFIFPITQIYSKFEQIHVGVKDIKDQLNSSNNRLEATLSTCDENAQAIRALKPDQETEDFDFLNMHLGS